MQLGEHSKSLNDLIQNQPLEFQTKIKKWWGKKLAISFFWLCPSVFGLGAWLVYFLDHYILK